MTSIAIRNRLYDYIRFADTKKLRAICDIIENDIEKNHEWWKDEKFVAELERRDSAMENGKDKGVTLEELETSISKLRSKKYGE